MIVSISSPTFLLTPEQAAQFTLSKEASPSSFTELYQPGTRFEAEIFALGHPCKTGTLQPIFKDGPAYLWVAPEAL